MQCVPKTRYQFSEPENEVLWIAPEVDVYEVDGVAFVCIARNNGRFARFLSKGTIDAPVKDLCLTKHVGYECVVQTRNQQACIAHREGDGVASEDALLALVAPISAAPDQGEDTKPGRVKGRENQLPVQDPWTPFQVTLGNKGACCMLKPLKASEPLWLRATAEDMSELVGYLRSFEDACFDRNYKYSLHGRYRKPKRQRGDEADGGDVEADAKDDA